MPFDAFLKVEGVPGESTDDKHKEWIEVLSFNWGVDQPQSSSASSHGSLSAERAHFHPFTIVKALDKASPKLAIGCASGEHYPKATLEICRAGGDKQPYMEYKMTDVMVNSFRPGGTGGGENIPLEEVSFSYGKIEWKYTQTKVAGGKGSGNVAAGWDLKTNKKV
ncbi:MAG TPA: type VI secretion system tube protein Hcp [Blastocatellia bacterium]|jgi:type VI secretion system secreted protein Hcp|nr:type VI secretion system tube protein Hcp [Blastocatellia bacterium]